MDSLIGQLGPWIGSPLAVIPTQKHLKISMTTRRRRSRAGRSIFLESADGGVAGCIESAKMAAHVGGSSVLVGVAVTCTQPPLQFEIAQCGPSSPPAGLSPREGSLFLYDSVLPILREPRRCTTLLSRSSFAFCSSQFRGAQLAPSAQHEVRPRPPARPSRTPLQSRPLQDDATPG
jgi:hypothetical protein